MANERTVWDHLLSKIGNAYGVAGLMGNLYAESALNPRNLQNCYEKSLHMTDDEYTAAVDSGAYADFDTDAAGYGLAQWTFSTRKKNLREFCQNRGASIGDLTAQLDFLCWELTQYMAVWDTLTGAKSVREASDAVLTKYERPADQSESMKSKRADFGQKYYNDYAATESRTGKEIMSAQELCDKMLDVAKNYQTIYMYAAYGFKVDTYNINQKAKQNLNGWYTKQNIATLTAVANRNPPYWGFDCVNLLKGLLWGWDGNASEEHGGAVYASNGVPDTNANGMIRRCYDVSDDFSNLQPGEGLWMEGHWGTYVGNGLAVECTSRWKNGVQITAVWNIGKKSGYNGRTWTKHGKLPWIEYTSVVTPEVPSDDPAVSRPTLKRGSKGADVKELQRMLIRLGYSVGASGVDGDFGPSTEVGVKAFQSANGLKVDGVVGPKTWAALEKADLLGRVTITTGTWNIRSGPGADYPSIGIAKGGETYPMSGYMDDNWVGIIYEDAKAWISKRAVKTN